MGVDKYGWVPALGASPLSPRGKSRCAEHGKVLRLLGWDLRNPNGVANRRPGGGF